MNNIESTVLQVVEKLEELASQNDLLWFNQQVLDQASILRQAINLQTNRKPLTDEELTSAIETAGIPVEDVELVLPSKI